jgi:hypothetical protein
MSPEGNAADPAARSGRRNINRKIVTILVVVAMLVVAVRVRRIIRNRSCRPPTLTVIDDPAQLDELHLELNTIELEDWVRRYHPEQSSAGYNLVLYQRRVPLIIDMNGRPVHSWPKVRATARIRLNRDGSLAVIGTDKLIKEYTWDGEVRWYFQLPDAHHLPHHDLIRLRNGNYLIMARGHGYADYLLEVDRQGSVVWEWRFEDHRESFPNWDSGSKDPWHSNSIRELPPNRWDDRGDQRFRAGNILVSARSLNTIFIIDKASGEVVWTHSKGFDGQHEAVMLDRSLRGAGLIMVFNNGLGNLFHYRRSRVQAINPITGEPAWEYGSDFFFSSLEGVAQALPGNNVLITSSLGGRVFEIKSRGRIVWEWAPAYLPMRVERVPYDHCPQLAALPIPVETEVFPKDRRPFVDADLYRFGFDWETEKRQIAGRERWVLRSTEGCRDLRVPVGATLVTEFGLDAGRLGRKTVRSRFRLTIDDRERPPETLVDTTLDETSDPLWRRQTTSMARYGMRHVTMCIETEIEGDLVGPTGIVLWANPQIRSREERKKMQPRARPITEQERKLREQQLEELGYVN